MVPFTVVRSLVIPLPDGDVDTDQIIPAQYVNVQGEAALAAALFAQRRAQNPAFVFNRPETRGRSIMLVGENFGCGSSREAAAWALAAWGIRALVGRSFNATFSNNCLQNGLLPAVAPAAAHEALSRILDRDPGVEVAVDLEQGRVVVADSVLVFPIDVEPFSRELLLRGIDELDYLLARKGEIDAFETRGDAS